MRAVSRPTRLALVLAVVAVGVAAATTIAYRSPDELRVRRVGPAPAVGAVFVEDSKGVTHQVCSGVVVDTRTEDVVVTAAHCLANSGRMLFAPAYHDGSARLGMWLVRSTHTDPTWQDHADPDADYAFLTVVPDPARHSTEPVQRAAGAVHLGLAPLIGDRVTVFGYPSDAGAHGKRLRCTTTARRTREFPTVDCPDFTDGVSGGPILERYDRHNGHGLLTGVIGGLQTGGCTADISYASPFTAETRVVLAAAVADQPSSPATRATITSGC